MIYILIAAIVIFAILSAISSLHRKSRNGRGRSSDSWWLLGDSDDSGGWFDSDGSDGGGDDGD